MRSLVGVATVVGVALLVSSATGCSTTPEYSDAGKYWSLVPTELVEPLVEGRSVREVEGPIEKLSENRRILAGLLDTGSWQRVVNIVSYDFPASSADSERDSTEDARAKAESQDTKVRLVSEDGYEGYVAYEPRFEPPRVTTRLTGPGRTIIVSAPATDEQADEFSDIVVDVALAFEENLALWDEANPPSD